MGPSRRADRKVEGSPSVRWRDLRGRGCSVVSRRRRSGYGAQAAAAGLWRVHAVLAIFALVAALGCTETPNSPPVAVDDTASTLPDVPFFIDALANDYDANGDELQIESYTQPASGTVVESANGRFFYTPPAGFEGSVTFTYTISDGQGLTATATVSVTVVNNPPLAVADAASTHADTALDIDVLANDSDPDGSAVTIESFTQPSDGVVVDLGGGTLS